MKAAGENWLGWTDSPGVALDIPLDMLLVSWVEGPREWPHPYPWRAGDRGAQRTVAGVFWRTGGNWAG